MPQRFIFFRRKQICVIPALGNEREMLSFAFRRKRRWKTQFSTSSGNAMSVVNCTFYRGFEDCTYGFAATNANLA